MDDLIERLRARSCVMPHSPGVHPDTECWEAADRITALEAELAVAQDYKDCGCSYDHPDDLCLGHEKLFKRLTDKRIAALEADNARLKRHIENNTKMWNADHAIAQKLIANNARLIGLVKEAGEALGNIESRVELASEWVNDSQEWKVDQYEPGLKIWDWLFRDTRATLAKIKETPNAG